MNGLTIATIGAWGHLGRVLGELDAAADPLLRVAAMAPAHAGEDPRMYREAHSCARDSDVFDDHRTMLDQARPDVVILSTRLDRITPIALEAARRGCHLICEKPLALQQQSLRELWDTCAENRVQCIAILNNHVHPAIVAARRAVEDGRLGGVAILNTRKSYKWGTRPDWFGRRSAYGGTIPWIGMHALDFLYSITAQTFTSVAAMHVNLAHPQHAECEDSAALVVKLSDGALATASLDLLRPAAADTHGDDWVRVVGSAGVLEANLTLSSCTLTTEREPAQSLPLAAPGPVFVPFIRSLADGSIGDAPCADMRRAFLLTYASLCAREAADTARVIPIGPVYAG